MAKTCYECGRTCKYLFHDSRCYDCTRLTQEEVEGVVTYEDDEEEEG